MGRHRTAGAGSLQNLPAARIGKQAEPVGKRIGAGRRRELVEETLDREDVSDLARRTQVVGRRRPGSNGR